MPNTVNDANYLSILRIAKELKRNRVCVWRYVNRHPRIQPAFTLNGYKYYTRATLAKIAKGMRRPNGNGSKLTSLS